ncbi:hypothetical protein EST38_g10250 [Candolleomyces aberdarensis]|uniref:Uncharacterized protein n=1 Tax=Candolleomyces aberdarensis TaxID=2316362 RepID=A0A4Q2DA29_9AGAR|nr:hypothetical protein EST38_g10250 [Candolleomyces aberdarensis]
MSSSEEGVRLGPISKTVYNQEDAKGSIYNGNISGGVNATTHESGGDNRSTQVVKAGNDSHVRVSTVNVHCHAVSTVAAAVCAAVPLVALGMLGGRSDPIEELHHALGRLFGMYAKPTFQVVDRDSKLKMRPAMI